MNDETILTLAAKRLGFESADEFRAWALTPNPIIDGLPFEPVTSQSYVYMNSTLLPGAPIH